MAHDPQKGGAGTDAVSRHWSTMRTTQARSGIRARKWDVLGNDHKGTSRASRDSWEREHAAEGQGRRNLFADRSSRDTAYLSGIGEDR
jgi:hypothetical protein